MNNLTDEFNVDSTWAGKRKIGFYTGVVICLLIGLASLAYPISNTVKKEMVMTSRATGTFDVKMTPVEDKFLDEGMGRMTGDKQLHGDLEGIGKGEMIYAGSATAKESGAYVAIEKITGINASEWAAHPGAIIITGARGDNRFGALLIDHRYNLKSRGGSGVDV